MRTMSAKGQLARLIRQRNQATYTLSNISKDHAEYAAIEARIATLNAQIDAVKKAL